MTEAFREYQIFWGNGINQNDKAIFFNLVI